MRAWLITAAVVLAIAVPGSAQEPSVGVVTTPEAGHVNATVPAAPMWVNASWNGTNVTVSWSASASSGTVNVTGYHVFQVYNATAWGAWGNATMKYVGATSAAVLSLNHQNVTVGNVYGYIVRAANTAGQGPPSPPAYTSAPCNNEHLTEFTTSCVTSRLGWCNLLTVWVSTEVMYRIHPECVPVSTRIRDVGPVVSLPEAWG